MTDATSRLGVLRPDRPIEVVARAEARVLQCELERRLGRVALDLRVDGDPIGGWQPIANAAWPTTVDAVVDGTQLWSPDLPPLTALYGRTIEPAAAEVRRRMLWHLGLLSETVFDRSALDALAALPLRPTDIWLMVTSAERVELDDPALVALAATPGGPEQATLDDCLDAIAGALTERATAEHERAAGTAEAARRRVVELADDLARSEREAAARLDELAAENHALRERVERLEIDARTDAATLDTP